LVSVVLDRTAFFDKGIANSSTDIQTYSYGHELIHGNYITTDELADSILGIKDPYAANNRT